MPRAARRPDVPRTGRRRAADGAREACAPAVPPHLPAAARRAPLGRTRRRRPLNEASARRRGLPEAWRATVGGRGGGRPRRPLAPRRAHKRDGVVAALPVRAACGTLRRLGAVADEALEYYFLLRMRASPLARPREGGRQRSRAFAVSMRFSVPSRRSASRTRPRRGRPRYLSRQYELGAADADHVPRATTAASTAQVAPGGCQCARTSARAPPTRCVSSAATRCRPSRFVGAEPRRRRSTAPPTSTGTRSSPSRCNAGTFVFFAGKLHSDGRDQGVRLGGSKKSNIDGTRCGLGFCRRVAVDAPTRRWVLGGSSVCGACRPIASASSAVRHVLVSSS